MLRFHRLSLLLTGFFSLLRMSSASIATFELQFTKSILDRFSREDRFSEMNFCLRPFIELSEIHESCPLGKRSLKKGELDASSPIKISIPSRIHVWQGGYALLLNVTYADREPERLQTSSNLPGNAGWQPVKFETNDSRPQLSGSARLVCASGFYGPRCSRRCSETERYECSLDGTKMCKQGWIGDQCETPICPSGCQNGTCVLPGKCRCFPGFEGTNCERCLPIVGCVHGGCANGQPNTCSCHPGWTGPLCDYDLEYCTRERPCLNGGVCRNGGVHQFICECPAGYSGDRCQIPVANPCSVEGICSNGGKCRSPDPGSYTCTCPRGFSGQHCQLSDFQPKFNACMIDPCQNGAQCLSMGNWAKCHCVHGFYGRYCELRQSGDPNETMIADSMLNPGLVGLWIIGFTVLSLIIYSLCKLGCRGRFSNYNQQNCLNAARNRLYKALPGNKEPSNPSLRREDVEKLETKAMEIVEARYTSCPRRLDRIEGLDSSQTPKSPLISGDSVDDRGYSVIISPRKPPKDLDDEISVVCKKVPFEVRC